MTVPTIDDFADVANQLDALSTRVASWVVVSPPEPEPELAPLFGTSAPKGIDNLETTIGVRFACHRTYDGGFPDSFNAHDAHVDVGKRASIASVKWWGDLNTAETKARAFARSWPAGHPGAFILDHEPEDNGTLAKFIDLQRVVSGVWRDELPDVPFGACFMSYDLDPNYTGPPIEEYLTQGAPYWDFVSWDGYDKGKGNTPKSAEDIFGGCRDMTTELTGLPMAVAEYGTTRDAERGKLTEAVADLVAAAGGVFATYWNSSNTGYPYPWKPADYGAVRTTATAYGGTLLPAGTVSAAEVEEQDDDHDDPE